MALNERTTSSTNGNEWLAPLDAAFLYLEQPNELLHVGAVAMLEGPVPFEDFVDVLGARLGKLRRYRQRPIRSFLDLSAPAWEEDPAFDPRRHIRRVQVPAPGRPEDLHRLVDELFPVPLDGRHPLWATYFIDGLADGGAAILSKVHHCMIDGVSGAQVLEVMTDETACPEDGGHALASREPPPGEHNGGSGILGTLGRDTLAGIRAALGTIVSPGAAFAQARGAIEAANVVADLARTPIAPMPFNGALTQARRIVWASFALGDFLAMRGAAGCKVNDIVLTVIAGALRRYLQATGMNTDGLKVRTLVPVSMRRDDEHLALGNRVSAMFATLPIGIADPLARLRCVSDELRTLKEQGQARAVGLALAVAGALPAPAGALLARLGTRRPLFHTVCTNVPGPRETRYVLGQRVLEIHPIVPLAAGIGLGFAIFSYDGKLSIAVTADAALVPDADRLPEALYASAEELRAGLAVATVPAERPAARGLTVADLMTADVAALAPHDSLAHAWETMQQKRIRHLPVVGRHERLIGLVTHRDLLAAAQSSLSFRTEAERVRLLGLARVEDVMETHLSTARPAEAATEAGVRMVRQKIGCLPVVDDHGHLTGIVTEEDFLRWATSHMEGAAA